MQTKSEPGQRPITGGLFLSSEANGLGDTRRIPVSQDQRNTARARVRLQAAHRLWFAFGGQYGSGLPAETTADPNFLLAQFGPEILSHVNLDRTRVRRNFSLDLAAGAELYHSEQRSAAPQIQATNLTDRLNLVNFASVFSGTAVAPQRNISARLKLTF